MGEVCEAGIVMSAFYISRFHCLPCLLDGEQFNSVGGFVCSKSTFDFFTISYI